MGRGRGHGGRRECKENKLSARHRENAKEGKGVFCTVETCFLAKGLSPSKLSTKALCRDTRRGARHRERERDRDTDRQREREKEGDRGRETETDIEGKRERAMSGTGIAPLIRN